MLVERESKAKAIFDSRSNSTYKIKFGIFKS